MNTLVPGDTNENESPKHAAVREETGVRVGSFEPEAGEIGSLDLCDIEEVKRAIWCMGPKKASGVDGITAKILHQA